MQRSTNRLAPTSAMQNHGKVTIDIVICACLFSLQHFDGGRIQRDVNVKKHERGIVLMLFDDLLYLD